MTVRALAGLAALNVAYALVGLSLLWALRSFRTLGGVLRLAGLGYLVGLAAFGVLWTTLLVAGVPFGGVEIAVTLIVLGAAGVIAGRRRGARFQRGLPRVSGTPMLLVSAAGIALTGLFLEALFRAARLNSLQEYDAWAFWVPKGKAIYFFDGLDEHVFTTAPNRRTLHSSPILDAAAFHAMGGADIVTLHVQFWFLVVGAVAAVAGLLHGRAPPWLLWPPLVLVLVVPRFGERLLAPQGTCSSTSSFVVGALLVALWLRDPAGWRLAAAAVLLAGAVKRSARESCSRRVCSPWRSRRLASQAVAMARCRLSVRRGRAALPWRLWAAPHDISRRGPPLVRRRPTGRSTRSASRADVLFSTCALVGTARSSSSIALGAASRLGRPASRGVRRAPRAPLPQRRRRSTSRFPELADQRRRVREPDRALHGLDHLPGRRRHAAAARIRLAKAARSP